MRILIILQAAASGSSPNYLSIGAFLIILVLIALLIMKNNKSQTTVSKTVNGDTNTNNSGMTKPIQDQDSSNNTDLSYVSAIGSAISLICFFAPWIGCSDKTISGADIGGEMWLVFITSAISLIAFFFFKSLKTLSKAKAIIVLSSLVGLGFMLFKYYKFQNNNYGFEIKWGSIATLGGMVISLLGVTFLADDMQPEKTDNENDKRFCSNCGKSYLSTSTAQFCDKCGNKLEVQV